MSERVINDPEEATPDWLTDVLRREEIIGDGEVVKVNLVLKKDLPVSRVARLRLTYSPGTPRSAPSTLFLKLSKPGKNDRLDSESVVSEAEFYGLVRKEISGPPLVRCYDAAYTEDRACSSVLLEDLTDTHFQPENGQPPFIGYSEKAVASLGEFHAYWHDNPKLGNGIGKIFDRQWLDEFVLNVEVSVDRFLDTLGNELHPEQQRAYDLMVSKSRSIWGRLTERKGLTITNGDAHWWNFLYPLDATLDDVRLFDWQLWHVDLGARDLAFLLALGGFADRRRDLEESLIRLYYDTLLKHGVRNYEWDTFSIDYRLSAVRNLNIPVIFWSQGRERELWSGMLERAFQAYSDLRCEELLNELT